MSDGRWKPGQSGNPNGRPKKGLALTELLERELNKAAPDIDGKRHQNKRILARLAIEAVTTGCVTFVKVSKSGEQHVVTQQIDPRDWMTWAKYVIDRIDGPAKQRMDVTTNDESLNDSGTLTDNQRREILLALLAGSEGETSGAGSDE
jgi:hypothetical protein